MNNSSTRLYNVLMGNPGNVNNAVGRTSGARAATGNPDNFFVKRGKSIENAIGTTLAAPISALTDIVHRDETDMILENNKKRLNEIAKKYGYETTGDYYDALQKAEEAGDNDTVNRLNSTIGEELKAQAKADADAMTKRSADYADYRQNSYIGQKINQDRGKFAGSAINTVSTMSDILLPGAGVAFNSAQGAAEGLADELEQNGFENFDAQRAAQNALTGAATGAVVGALNKGISNSLAKKGGNLFKGGNALTRGINDLGSKTALGRGVSTIATGVGRGAISGAVGGATGAGLSAAMNNQDVIGSALEGAKQGAAQGALAGGVMAGANMAINKTPGIGKVMQQVNQASEDWKNSGRTFDERLTNTLNSGDSAVGNWLNRRSESKLLNSVGNVGNRVQDVSGQRYSTVDPLGNRREYTADEVRQLIDEYEKYKAPEALSGNSSSEVDEALGSAGVALSEIFRNQNGGDFNPYSRADGEAFNRWVQNTKDTLSTPTTTKGWLKRAGERIIEDANERGVGLSLKNVASSDPWDRIAQEAGYNNYDEVIQRYIEANPDTPLNPNGAAGQILSWMDQNPNTPTTLGGWAKRAGERIVEDANNRGVGLSVKDVADESQVYSDDINNMKVSRNDMITNPEPEVTQSSKTSTANKLRNEAGMRLQKQYGAVDKPTAKATNAPETLQKISDAGFTKPADVERMADAITGSNGEVSKLVANLVKTAKPVDTFAGETSGQTLDDYIDLSIQKRGLDGINEGKAVKSQISALMRSLPSRADGSISFTDTPEDTFRMTQLLDAEAANYEGRSGMNYGTTNPDKLRAAQVLKDVSNLMKDRIYETVDVKQALTPEVAQNLKAYDPNNKAWADYVDNEIMNASSVKDLRSVQAPWVRAKKIIDNGYMNSVTYGGRNGGSSSIPLTKRGLVGAALDATINSKPGLRLQAKALNKAADFADRNTNTTATTTPDATTAAPVVNNTTATTTPDAIINSPSTQIYNAIGRTTGLTNGEQAKTANYLINAAQEAEVVPNTGANTLEGLMVPTANTGATNVYNSVYGMPNATTAVQQTATPSTGYFPATGDYWTDILATALSSAIDDNDSAAFATLYEMYQDALSKNSKSSGKDYSDVTNWNSGDRTKLLSAQNAMDQIDQLEKAYNTATSGNGGNVVQGWLRSRAADISGGNWDPSASNYNNMAQSVGMGIVKNLINLGVTEADAQRYLQYLPSLTDTKVQAQQKLDTLRSIYQSQINNLYSAYGA